MANKLFQQTQENSFQGVFSQFQQNPMQFLTQRNINIPQEFQNNPKGAVQNMLNSGQMSQQQLNKLMQMANKMGIKLN